MGAEHHEYVSGMERRAVSSMSSWSEITYLEFDAKSRFQKELELAAALLLLTGGGGEGDGLGEVSIAVLVCGWHGFRYAVSIRSEEYEGTELRHEIDGLLQGRSSQRRRSLRRTLSV